MKIANLNLTMRGLHFEDKNGNSLSLAVSLKKITNRFISYFVDLQLFFLNIVGSIPFHSVRRFFYAISGIKMARGSVIHMGARFYDPKNIEIGEGTIIGNGCFIDGRSKVTIGKQTDIASDVMIYNSEHDLTDPNFTAIEEPVSIGSYVFIGPRAIILPGVKIGDGAVVAAGAVVTKDIAEKNIVGGVPAKVIGERQISKLNYKLGRARLFQ